MPPKKLSLKPRSSRRVLRRKVPESTKTYVKTQLSRGKEMKVSFLTRGQAALGSTFTVADLSSIAQGDAFNERIGDSVKIKDISIGCRLTANTTNANNLVRVMVWRTKYEGTPAALDVLQDGTMPQSLISRYRETPQLSHVLYDRVFNLTTQVSSDNKDIVWNIFLRKNLGAQVDYVAGTTGAPKNKIWIVFQAVNNTNQCTFGFESATRYKDM